MIRGTRITVRMRIKVSAMTVGTLAAADIRYIVTVAEQGKSRDAGR